VAGAAPIICLPFFNNAFNNRQTTQEREENELTGTLKLAFRPTDDLLTYLSYARGYKSGGFNLDRSISGNGQPTGNPGPFGEAVRDTSFAPEFVDSYEAGFKSTLLNGQLLFNATVFHQIFENFQLNTFLGTTFVVESIPEVTSTGVDADLIYLTPIDGLTLTGGLTYTDTRYEEFGPTDLANPTRFNQLQLLPGERLSFAPELSGTASFTYERPIGNLLGRAFLGAKYTSEYNTKSDLLPLGQQDAFTLLNGRLSLGTNDERVTLELWGQNLTDEEYFQVVFNQTLQGSAFVTPNFAAGQLVVPYNPAADTVTYGAFLGQPRTYGLTLRIKY
jgi:outer membrane receptor protein involved in Fe transport